MADEKFMRTQKHSFFIWAAISAAALALVVIASGAQAQESDLTGMARVMDSDKLIVQDVYLRLWAIDAPELGQPCLIKNEVYACNAVAYRALEILVADGPVSCSYREDDSRQRRGKIYAVCVAIDGTNINDAMVRQGQALAFFEQSEEFAEAEAAAAQAGVGLWRGAFDAPWEWLYENFGGAGD